MVKVSFIGLLLGMNLKQPGSLLQLEQIAQLKQTDGTTPSNALTKFDVVDDRQKQPYQQQVDDAVKLLIDEAKTKVGQVGSLATVEQRSRMEELASDVVKIAAAAAAKGSIGIGIDGPSGSMLQKLVAMMKGQQDQQVRQQQPARYPLTGVHNLVYSAAPGASSGRIFGNVIGRVSQLFEDDEIFYNRVDFGPFQIALRAKRQVINDRTIKVTFLETSINLFGQTLSKKDAGGGGGVWKVKYVGTVKDDDGKEKLVRIMETPSLFVLEQDLSNS